MTRTGVISKRYGSGVIFIALIGVWSCSIPWLDHAPNRELAQELLERSRQGLSLAACTTSGLEIKLRFFDGNERAVKVGCCRAIQFCTIANNQIIVVDQTREIERNTSPDRQDMTDGLGRHPGQLVLLSDRGKETARS